MDLTDILDMSWVQKLLDLKPPFILMIGLYVVGRVIKAIPGVPNWVILAALPANWNRRWPLLRHYLHSG